MRSGILRHWEKRRKKEKPALKSVGREMYLKGMLEDMYLLLALHGHGLGFAFQDFDEWSNFKKEGEEDYYYSHQVTNSCIIHTTTNVKQSVSSDKNINVIHNIHYHVSPYYIIT